MKFASATGRRKTAVAQVRLLPGNGKVLVNKTSFEEYFPVDIYRLDALRPFNITKTDGRYDMFVTVRGGGKSGQTGAVQLAAARALLQIDEEFRKPLRDAGLLTRDPRMVERKKYGQKKARKRFQFSKR
jgi:small subunit ribosomal protein S9